MEETSELFEFLEAYLNKVGPFMEQVMIFIDGGYLHSCLNDQFHRADLDLTKFSLRLLQGRRLARTYFYTAKIENPSLEYWRKIKKEQQYEYWRKQQSEQQGFLMSLAYKPFIEPRLGRLQFSKDGSPRQKGVDVLLALDMLRFALKKNYDVAILVSGDGDFADIVRMVKDEGRKVQIVTFPGTRAYELMAACDENIEVTTELLEGCWQAEEEKRVDI